MALAPHAAHELVRAGHRLLVEAGAGEASGFADAAYAGAGARVVDDARGAFAEERAIAVGAFEEVDRRLLSLASAVEACSAGQAGLANRLAELANVTAQGHVELGRRTDELAALLPLVRGGAAMLLRQVLRTTGVVVGARQTDGRVAHADWRTHARLHEECDPPPCHHAPRSCCCARSPRRRGA